MKEKTDIIFVICTIFIVFDGKFTIIQHGDAVHLVKMNMKRFT